MFGNQYTVSYRFMFLPPLQKSVSVVCVRARTKFTGFKEKLILQISFKQTPNIKESANWT